MIDEISWVADLKIVCLYVCLRGELGKSTVPKLRFYDKEKFVTVLLPQDKAMSTIKKETLIYNKVHRHILSVLSSYVTGKEIISWIYITCLHVVTLSQNLILIFMV